MANQARNVLFRIGERYIVQDGLYIHIGPSNNRLLAAGYNPKRNDSTWLAPGINGLMALVLKNPQLHDIFENSEPIIYFEGGPVRFDFGYLPTSEQQKIIDNWNAELEKAGIGGHKVPDLKIKEEFAERLGSAS
jgi:hypothetical protein